MLVGGVVAAAAVRTFPFRVFSFPSEIRPLTPLDVYLAEQRKVFPYVDLRYVNVDDLVHDLRSTLPLGVYDIGDEDHPLTTGTFYGIQRSGRPMVCTSVDPITKTITWESA